MRHGVGSRRQACAGSEQHRSAARPSSEQAPSGGHCRHTPATVLLCRLLDVRSLDDRAHAAAWRAETARRGVRRGAFARRRWRSCASADTTGVRATFLRRHGALPALRFSARRRWSMRASPRRETSTSSRGQGRTQERDSSIRSRSSEEDLRVLALCLYTSISGHPTSRAQ